MESISSFLSRVAAEGCNISLTNITILQDGDHMPGPILARRGNVYLCGVGYPTEDDEGAEVYRQFQLVYISQSSGIDPEDNLLVSDIFGAIKAPIAAEAYASDDIEEWEEAGGWNRLISLEAPFQELGFKLNY